MGATTSVPSYGIIPFQETVPGGGTFRLQLGQAIINRINALAQFVNVTIYELNIDWQIHPNDLFASNITNAMFAFCAGVYTPPAASPSDPCRIDSLEILTIEPPYYPAPDKMGIRRFKCAVHFTIL